MVNTIPKWIIALAAVFAVMALFLSFQSLSTESFAYAARNAIPAIVTIVTLLFFRNSVVAYILIFVGRMTIELGDLVTGLTSPGSAEAEMLPMVAVLLVLEAFIIYLLSKKLSH
jgi:hypothetical protein